LNTAARWSYSSVTNVYRPSLEVATSIALADRAPWPVPLGAASVPSTAPADPDSARATLMTSAPLPSAASRYVPSGVIVSPSGWPATGIDLTSTGGPEVVLAIRSTSITEPPVPPPRTATNP
jgi:hypothetical protein